MFKSLGIPCKVCGRVFGNSKSDREEHDSVCNPNFRHNALKEQIELESRHQEEIGYFSKPNRSSSTKQVGAYTSKLYQGQSSSEVLARSKKAGIGERHKAVHETELDRSLLSAKRRKSSSNDESSIGLSEYEIEHQSMLGKGNTMTGEEANINDKLSTITNTTLPKNVLDSGFVIDQNSFS